MERASSLSAQCYLDRTVSDPLSVGTGKGHKCASLGAAGYAVAVSSRSLRAVVLCVVVVLAAGAVGLIAAPAASRSCLPQAATVLAKSGAARLYSSGGQLYGCLGTRTTRLGALGVRGRFPHTRVTLYALAGRYAGIDVAAMGIDTFDSTLIVIDLATGRRVASAPATSPENRAESFITARSLVIDPGGTVAWVGARSAVGAFTPIYEVRALSAHGDRLLDSGTHIRPASLALTAHQLSWTDGTMRRHAQLEP